MTEEKSFPKLSKDEAIDLSDKLAGLDAQLSENQRSYLHFAVNAASRKNEREVEGFDYGNYYDTGYYDLNTGLEIYAVDWYTNYGAYEGTSYYE